MPTIEQFGQQQREIQQKEREANEPQGPGLNEILAHPEDSALFAKYLERGGDESQLLGVKLLAGELARNISREDFHALNEERKEFLAIRERAKNVREKLEKNFDGIINASPELRESTQVAGADAVRSAVIKRMDEIAITDPERFADLEGRLSGLAATEESVARGNERLDILRKQYGFTEQEYTKALKAREGGDPYALEDLIKSKMGSFKKAFTSYEDLTNQEEEIDTRQDIKNRLSAVNFALGNIGGALDTALFDDPKTREVLMAGFVKEKGPEKETSFAEMRKLSKKIYHPERIQAAWSQYESEHQNDDGFDRDAARTHFADAYAEQVVSKKRLGFWATIFRTMLSGGVQSILK